MDGHGVKDMRASNVHIRKVRTGPSLPAGPQIDATQMAIREQVAARNAANAARRRRRKRRAARDRAAMEAGPMELQALPRVTVEKGEAALKRNAESKKRAKRLAMRRKIYAQQRRPSTHCAPHNSTAMCRLTTPAECGTGVFARLGTLHVVVSAARFVQSRAECCACTACFFPEDTLLDSEAAPRVLAVKLDPFRLFVSSTKLGFVIAAVNADNVAELRSHGIEPIELWPFDAQHSGTPARTRGSIDISSGALREIEVEVVFFASSSTACSACRDTLMLPDAVRLPLPPALESKATPDATPKPRAPVRPAEMADNASAEAGDQPTIAGATSIKGFGQLARPLAGYAGAVVYALVRGEPELRYDPRFTGRRLTLRRRRRLELAFWGLAVPPSVSGTEGMAGRVISAHRMLAEVARQLHEQGRPADAPKLVDYLGDGGSAEDGSSKWQWEVPSFQDVVDWLVHDDSDALQRANTRTPPDTSGAHLDDTGGTPGLNARASSHATRQCPLPPPPRQQLGSLRGPGGESIMHHAAALGARRCLRLLIEQRVIDVGAASTSTGDTPAHWAAYSGQVEALRALYEAGADLKVANKEGNTPAHQAAVQARCGALLFLVGADAAVGEALRKQRNRRGATAYDLLYQLASTESAKEGLGEHAAVFDALMQHESLARKQSGGLLGARPLVQQQYPLVANVSGSTATGTDGACGDRYQESTTTSLEKREYEILRSEAEKRIRRKKDKSRRKAVAFADEKVMVAADPDAGKGANAAPASMHHRTGRLEACDAKPVSKPKDLQHLPYIASPAQQQNDMRDGSCDGNHHHRSRGRGRNRSRSRRRRRRRHEQSDEETRAKQTHQSELLWPQTQIRKEPPAPPV